MIDSETARFEVPNEAAGQRLDRYLAERLGVARSRMQKWIRAGDVTVDGVGRRSSYVLRGNERVEVVPPAPRPDERVVAERGDLEVLFEDAAILVLDKPANLAMHPGAGRPGGTLVNRVVERFPKVASVGGEGRPGVVHRLDLDTTGVVVLARTDEAYAELSRDFSEREVVKAYLAICYGEAGEGTVREPIGRHPRDRKMMAVRPDGRPAHTDYSTLATAERLSLLEVGLHTGRTHQIRVHLKAIRHPLVGDPVYGEDRWKEYRGELRALLRGFPRPALHAWKLSLRHPTSRKRMTFSARLPDDIRGLWSGLGGTLPEEVAGDPDAADSTRSA